MIEDDKLKILSYCRKCQQDVCAKSLELMKIDYKLYKPTLDSLTPQQQILYNRDIPVEEQSNWLNAYWNDVNDFHLLKNIKDAAVMIINHCMCTSSKITILQDADADGLTSSAIIANYIHRICNKEPTILIHEGKAHGLADIDLDKIIETTSLLILPDSSSNDYEQHKYLHDNGVDIVIADHHHCEKYSEDAIVVNNQLDDYPNKNFCGAGVTWQLCRQIDELLNVDYANDLVDLCALGLCGDMMSYREKEVRALVNIGYANVKNKFFKAFVDKQEFSLNKMNGLNYLSSSFYVVPYINACCRTGEMVEKRLLINALLDYKCDTMIPSSKRGEKGKEVPIWQEAITVIERVKRRQTKLQDEAMEFFEYQIQTKKLTDNAIITCVCGKDDAEPGILGLVANKIQAKYQHPTLVLQEVEEEDGIHLKGSARNYSYCPIEDMRSLCEDTGVVDYASGHGSAFGLSLPLSNFYEFLDKTNEQYNGVDFKPVYLVDYIWNYDRVNPKYILDIAELNIYGQGIPESKVVVKDIALDNVNVQLLGEAKGHPTIKISLPSGVDIMKFKSSREEFEEWISGEKNLTIVGTCSKNSWMGNVTPQILIDDFELEDYEEEWVF